MSSPQSVSVDQMRQILNEIIDALESPDYASKLDEAKEAAGNEMLKMMQIVFPMVVQIEMETIKHHGFNNSREGMPSSFYYVVFLSSFLLYIVPQYFKITNSHVKINNNCRWQNFTYILFNRIPYNPIAYTSQPVLY